MDINVLAVLIIILIILVGIALVLIIRISKPSQTNEFAEILQNKFREIDSLLREELSLSRSEADKNSRDNREEYTKVQSTQLQSFADMFAKLTTSLEQKLTNILNSSDDNSRKNREELSKGLEAFGKELNNSIKELNESQKRNFDEQIKKQGELSKDNEFRLERMRETIEQKLKSLQEDNSKKLDEMRATVDEKLQTTLEKRLGESFKLVSERLELVHKGLGEMQQLATGVGDLKKVLANVKTRGVLGEYQLINLIEQLLTAEQYALNVKTKPNSNALVEVAVKLPGRDENHHVWIPIDAKFPTEDFQMLIEAYETANLVAIEEKSKALINRIRLSAKDIRDKYISPPYTTDFGIMFLPFEGLYAEVLRVPGLFEQIRKDYGIVITGPTTLSAFLNSLQMGFRTLAIEKRSSEVWDLLSAVKTEFGSFGAILEKTQKKLQEASNVIEQASTRSRVIERKLKSVQELPREKPVQLLDENSINEISDPDNNSIIDEEEISEPDLFV